MQSATIQVWNALVAWAQEVPAFKDVRAYPLRKVKDGEFFKDIPDLQMPACLLIFKDAEDSKGVRTCSWSAAVVDKDAGGKAFESAVELADALRDKLEGARICEGAVLIPHTASVAAVRPT